MIKAADHPFLRAHLLEELEGYQAELDAIEDLRAVEVGQERAPAPSLQVKMWG